MEHKPPLFRCTPAQACLAIVPACIVLAALILVFIVFVKGQRFTDFRISDADSHGYVTVTEVHGTAQSAGLKVNDRIRWSSLNLGERLDVGWARKRFNNQPLSLVARRGNEQRKITIIAHDHPNGPDFVFSAGLHLLIALATLVIGTLLVLLRPSKATWAWFIVSLWIAGSGLNDPDYDPTRGFSFLPAGAFLIISQVFMLLQPAAYLSLAVFAMYFPNRRPQGLARLFDRLVPY